MNHHEYEFRHHPETNQVTIDAKVFESIAIDLAITLFQHHGFRDINPDLQNTSVNIIQDKAIVKLQFSKKISFLLRFPFTISYELSNSLEDPGLLVVSRLKVFSTVPAGNQILKQLNAPQLVANNLMNINQTLIDYPPKSLESHLRNVDKLELVISKGKVLATAKK